MSSERPDNPSCDLDNCAIANSHAFSILSLTSGGRTYGGNARAGSLLGRGHFAGDAVNVVLTLESGKSEKKTGGGFCAPMLARAKVRF